MASLENIRILRKESIPTETKMWRYLRSRRFSGLKFRRQYSIGPYATQSEYDANHTDYINAEGCKVIRFWNNDVSKQFRAIMKEI